MPIQDRMLAVLEDIREVEYYQSGDDPPIKSAGVLHVVDYRSPYSGDGGKVRFADEALAKKTATALKGIGLTVKVSQEKNAFVDDWADVEKNLLEPQKKYRESEKTKEFVEKWFDKNRDSVFLLTKPLKFLKDGKEAPEGSKLTIDALRYTFGVETPPPRTSHFLVASFRDAYARKYESWETIKAAIELLLANSTKVKR